MPSPTRRVTFRLLAGGGAAAALARPSLLHAQEPYPSRPVRVIVPFGPGGGTDDFTRRFMPQLGGGIGERVFIENRPGGNTLLGTELAARARADGYTILMQTNNFTVNAVLHERLPYDTLRDFAPVSLAVRVPHMLIVNNDVPASTLQELLALARAQPGRLNFGSSGIGTNNHVAGEMLKRMADIRMEHVPYRSGAEYVTELLAGRIHMVFAGAPQGIQLARAGSVRAIAVTSRVRPPEIPEVPTMEEAGMPGFEIYSWYGFLVPAATPEPIVAKLAREMQATARDPRITEGIPSTERVGSTPEQFAAFLRDDLARTSSLLRSVR